MEFWVFFFGVRGQYTIFLHSLPENENYPAARESYYLLAVVRNNNFVWGSTPWKVIFYPKGLRPPACSARQHPVLSFS